MSKESFYLDQYRIEYYSGRTIEQKAKVYLGLERVCRLPVKWQRKDGSLTPQITLEMIEGCINDPQKKAVRERQMQDIAKRVKEYHDAAMADADKAMMYDRKNDGENAKLHWKLASLNENKAADLLEPFKHCEPTRSVIMRSCACMLMRCGYLSSAHSVIQRALLGSPLPEIKAELLELKAEIESKLL